MARGVAAAWMGMALAMACTPELGVPAEAQLRCGTSAECPFEMDCHPFEGRCVAHYVPDVDGPKVTAAVAESETTLIVFFDEPLDPEGVDDPANYEVAPDLDVRLASLRSDETSVRLATGLQSPTRAYTLTVTGLRDPSGNVVDPDHDTAEFAGFGAPPSTDAPIRIAPADGARIVAGEPVSFAWSRPEGALEFTWQLASDPAFETPVHEAAGDLSFHTVTADESAAFEAVDHYWRVRTEHSGWSDPWRLVVEDPEAVYVAPCEMSRSDASGNRGDPFCAVGDAVVYASATAGEAERSREVRVAAGTYTEVVSLLPGVTLRGSYDVATWTASPGPPSTLIQAPPDVTTTLTVGGAHGARLERIEVVNDNDIPAAYGAFVFGSHDVVIDDSVFRGGNHFDPTGLRIWSSDRVRVRSVRSVGGGPRSTNPRGLWVTTAADLHIEDSFFTGSEEVDDIHQGTYGVYLSFAHAFRIEGSTVYGGAIDRERHSAGIRLVYSDGVIDGNTIFGAHPERPEIVPGWSNAINVFLESPIVDSRPEASVIITNNVIRTGRASRWAIGIAVDPFGVPDCDTNSEDDRETRLFVANNTFVLENHMDASDEPRQAAYVRPSDCTQAWNNLVVGLHGIQWTHGFWQQWRDEDWYPGDEVRPVYGHNLVVLAGDSATLRAQDGSLRNAAEGELDLDGPWSEPLDDPECITGPSQNPVNDCPPPVRPPTIGNRTSFQTPAEIFMDPDAGDFRPRPGSDALGAGANLTGVPGFGDDIVRDRDGVARPATGAWTIGAYQ